MSGPTSRGFSTTSTGVPAATARTAERRGIADLVTAVLAAEHRITVVHYDADFEIAEVVEFEHRWVAPRGKRVAGHDRCPSPGVRGATRYKRTRLQR